MNIKNIQLHTNFIFLGIIFIVSFLFIPQKTFAACELATGQFRNFDFGLSFQPNWFANSVAQNNAQPYIYLDLKFTPDCVGNNSISIAIEEHDSLDPNDGIIGPLNLPTITQQTLEQTSYFRAGDVWCDSGDAGDCDYFLLLEINDEEYSFSPGGGGVGTQAHPLNIEYDCSGDCENQTWQYIGTVHSGTMSSFTYGTFVAENDPDLQNSQNTQSTDGESTNTQSTDEESVNVQSTTQYIPEALNCNNGEGVACIENPLGDGSNLPAFIQSLLSIIVRAGIPLVVLALVFTGFKFVAARGNPDKISEAKQILLWTVIGTAVLLGAWTIATILSNTINQITASIIIYLA